MNVYTFYEPINDFGNKNQYDDLIKIWKKSWQYYGWNPIILNLNDAKKHPDYNFLYQKCKEFPTVNHKTYELYCFLRWLAIAQYGGWVADIDIINYGFTPVDFGEMVVTTRYDKSLCGTSFYMSKNKYIELIEEFKNYQISEKDMHMINNQKIYHISDMTVKQQTRININLALKIHGLYGNSTYKNDLLVHYTSPCADWLPCDKGKTRVQLIEEDERSKVFLNE